MSSGVNFACRCELVAGKLSAPSQEEYSLVNKNEMIIRPFHLQVSEMTRGAVLGSDDDALLRDSPLRPRPPWRGRRRVGEGSVVPERLRRNGWSVYQGRRRVAQAGKEKCLKYRKEGRASVCVCGGG